MNNEPLEQIPQQEIIPESPGPTNNPEKLPPRPEEYVLTGLERELFTDIQAQLDQAQRQIMGLNNQAAGGIRMILKTHALEGAWDLAPDYSRLIRKSELTKEI